MITQGQSLRRDELVPHSLRLWWIRCERTGDGEGGGLGDGVSHVANGNFSGSLLTKKKAPVSFMHSYKGEEHAANAFLCFTAEAK